MTTDQELEYLLKTIKENNKKIAEKHKQIRKQLEELEKQINYWHSWLGAAIIAPFQGGQSQTGSLTALIQSIV